MQTEVMAGSTVGAPRVLLRLEGLSVLCVALWLFVRSDGMAVLGLGWPALAALFFAPDLAMLAYLRGPRAGAILYNAAHAYLAPLALIAAGTAAGAAAGTPLALLWIAHIGFDRMLGYGLKYSTAFSDTHLGRIGRAAQD